MLFKDAAGLFKDLYLEGGIEILTPDSGKGPGVLAKTVIQPDADVIMYVSDEIFSRPDVWDAHREKLRKKIGVIHFFGLFLGRLQKALRIVGVILLSIGGGASVIGEGSMYLLIPSIGGGVLSIFAPPLVGRLFKAYIRRKMKKSG